MELKRQIYKALDYPENHESQAGYWVNLFLFLLILLNVFAVILETVPAVYLPFEKIFRGFEAASIIIFTIEYLLRIWSCTANPEYAKPVLGRLRFGISMFALVDLAVILPFYLPFIIPVDLRFLRILRVFRMIRVLKLARYMKSLRFLIDVIKAKKTELCVAFSLLVVLLLLASTLIFYAEHNAQPDKFTSIPESMWWGVVTLTTVGYGDVFPVTPIGKFVSAVIAILGIGLFALPTGILTAGIIEELQKGKAKKCPHCGKPL